MAEVPIELELTPTEAGAVLAALGHYIDHLRRSRTAHRDFEWAKRTFAKAEIRALEGVNQRLSEEMHEHQEVVG